jgi:hypothetical protein
MTIRTEEEWLERFGDVRDTQEGTTLHETYGTDLETVRSADPLTVWSVIEGDETENLYLLPGFHSVNLIGYVLSEKPITQEELDSGEWNETLWVDQDDFSPAP